MTFTDMSIAVREISNGALFVSSVILLGLFVTYIIRSVRDNGHGWYRDISAQAAIAISILLLGHAIRAGSSWSEFMWLHAGWETPWWANAVWIFAISTAITLLGKTTMILAFASTKWRLRLVILLLTASILIPVWLMP